MRTYYWYLIAYWKKHGRILISSVVAAVIIFSFFLPLAARSLEQKKRMYIGIVGEYTIDALPRNIQQLISTGLTQVDQDGSVIPAASARWNVEDSGKTYRFVVKKGIYWQDGKELEPADISYQFNDVQTITTPNDVVFKLPDAFVPFPTVVTQPLLRVTTEPHLFFFERPKIIGLGEYRVLRFEQRERQLQRNPRLTELVLDGKQERRIYRFYLNEDEAIDAFKRGEVDILTNLSTPHDIGAWRTTKTVETLHPERYLAVFFDQNNPLFSKNIRQALAYAVHKQMGEERAVGPINPQSWAYLDGAKSYDYDLDRATERLLSAVPEQALEFELMTTSSFAQRAEQIKADWEEFGEKVYTSCQSSKEVTDKAKCEFTKIKVNLKISNFPDTSNFQALLVGQESPPDPDQYYLWHSEQSTNFTNYKNTRIDSLLERGRQIVDKQERKAIYQEFQQFLLEDTPAIFLEHLKSYEVSRE